MKILNQLNEHKEFLMRNLEMINDILEGLYGSPDHGNKSSPMDELIYIHLSKKTNEKGYSNAFDRLSSAFPQWKGLAEADKSYVKSLISSAGLGENRTNELLHNIKIIKIKFGKETLDQLKSWSDEKIFDFLTSLKGIGPKSAKCIMMYSLGKDVFPVDTHVHTICERTGFIESRLNHKVAQEKLADIFPKKYRYSLHVNMVAHGRIICKKRGTPKCDHCQLMKFCYKYRNSIKNSNRKFSMIDLFCGSGGASLGFAKAGFNIRFAIDNDIHAIDTYYLNHPELSFNEVHLGDIRELDNKSFRDMVEEKIDLIIGGPPCQGWSGIGKNRKNGINGKNFLEDERNTLYTEFVRQLDNFKPRYFVMENVPGLLTAHNGKYANIIRDDFRVHGYESEIIILNTIDFGIPQNRKRIFFIGGKIYKNEGDEVVKNRLSRIIELIKSEARRIIKKLFKEKLIQIQEDAEDQEDGFMWMEPRIVTRYRITNKGVKTIKQRN